MILPVNKIFYTNGILTPEKGAEKTAREIKQITGLDVEVFHNGSTPLTTIISIAGKILYGIFGLGYYAATSKKKEEKEDDDRNIIAVGSVAALGLGLKEWHDVQVNKAEHGKALADRVEAYLNKHPNESVLLILHSQGAHVGLNALKHLKPLKDRIQVVNMGGMVEVPKHLAESVTNLANSNDPVPKWIAPFYSKGREWINLGDDHTKTLLGHEMKEYLRHDLTQQILKNHSAAAAA